MSLSAAGLVLLLAAPAFPSWPGFGAELEAKVNERLRPVVPIAPIKLHETSMPLHRCSLLEIAPPTRTWLGFGCLGHLELLAREPDGLIDLFGGIANFRTAVFADRVELFRTEIDASATIERRVPLPLEPEDAAALRALLTFDASYAWYSEFNECPPQYDYRATLTHRDRTIAVDLDLRGQLARVIVDGDEIAATRMDFATPAMQRIIDRTEALERYSRSTPH